MADETPPVSILGVWQDGRLLAVINNKMYDVWIFCYLRQPNPKNVPFIDQMIPSDRTMVRPYFPIKWDGQVIHPSLMPYRQHLWYQKRVGEDGMPPSLSRPWDQFVFYGYPLYVKKPEPGFVEDNTQTSLSKVLQVEQPFFQENEFNLSDGLFCRATTDLLKYPQGPLKDRSKVKDLRPYSAGP